jgi:NADPH:quinone reductase-like Zn-dependent oxidoreductase
MSLKSVAFVSLALLIAAPGWSKDVQLPTSTRKVVLEKAEKGYRWALTQAPVPTPGEHQVLVHVRAVSLNRGDLEMLEASGSRDYSGLVVASDAAGDVVSVGKAVKSARPGQRVTSLYFRNWTEGPPSREKLSQAHGAQVDGVLGDYIVLEDTAVAPMPKSLSYEEAASLPTAGLTGWMASASQVDLAPGDVVLVQGTGGVSTFALQFAAAAGARVIVTSSSDEKIQRSIKLGAREGINYKTTPAWSERVLALTDKQGAKVVVDVGGKSTLEQSAKSLAFLGTLSIVGGLSGYDGSVPALPLLLKTATARGIFVGSREDYLRMSAFIDKHRIKPAIDRSYPLDQFQQALDQMASGNFVGKIVLTL